MQSRSGDPLRVPQLIVADVIFVVFISTFLALLVFWLAGHGLLPNAVPNFARSISSTGFSWLTGISGITAAVLAFLFKRALTIWHPIAIVALAAALVFLPFMLASAHPPDEKWAVTEHVNVKNWTGEWNVRFDGSVFDCSVSAPGTESAQCVAASAGNRRFVHRLAPGTDQIACIFSGQVEAKQLIGDYFCAGFDTRLIWKAKVLAN